LQLVAEWWDVRVVSLDSLCSALRAMRTDIELSVTSVIEGPSKACSP
jgi:hypothetical protein